MAERDKVLALAEKLFHARMSRLSECERILRAELKPLLEAIDGLLDEDLCQGRRTIEHDGSEAEKKLAAERKGWTKE